MVINKPVILYDSECELCKRFKQAIIIIDSKGLVSFHDVNDKNFYTHFEFLNFEDCKDKVHLIDEHDNILNGSQVVEYLVKILPGVSKFSWLLDYDMGKKAINVFYDVVDKIKRSHVACDKCKR